MNNVYIITLIMSCLDFKLVDLVLNEAFKSCMEHRHGAIVLDVNGKLIASGYNKRKSDKNKPGKSCVL